MLNKVEDYGLTLAETEQRAAARARDKVRGAGWDASSAVLAYATLVAVILLKLEGIAIEIVATIAVVGLALVWLMGWRRGRQLFRRFYKEELRQLQEPSREKEARASIPSLLTKRETEILGYVAHGYINKQIAGELGLSAQTIKNQLSSILRKLEVGDRTQAVVLAIRNGWISSSDREQSEFTVPSKTSGSMSR